MVYEWTGPTESDLRGTARGGKDYSPYESRIDKNRLNFYEAKMGLDSRYAELHSGRR